MQLSLPEALREVAARYPDRVALRQRRPAAELLWGEWRGQAERVAAAFVSTGLEPGERVALVGPGSIAMAVADLATLMAGGVAVPLGPHWTIDGLALALGCTKPRWVVCAAPSALAKVSEACALASLAPRWIGITSTIAAPWPPTLDAGFLRATLDEHPHFILSWEQLLSLGESAHRAQREILRERTMALSPTAPAALLVAAGAAALATLGHDGSVHVDLRSSEPVDLDGTEAVFEIPAWFASHREVVRWLAR